MKNKSIIIATVVATVSLGTAAIYSVPSLAHGTKTGQGQMSEQSGQQMGGQGQMGGMMGGQGGMMGGHSKGHMMGVQGHMGSMMGGYMMGIPGATLDLGVDDVRNIIEGRMAMHGNDRLKVGKVEAVDDDTIVAEIVTVDDSLVMKMEFDRKTGAHHPVK